MMQVRKHQVKQVRMLQFLLENKLFLSRVFYRLIIKFHYVSLHALLVRI